MGLNYEIMLLFILVTMILNQRYDHVKLLKKFLKGGVMERFHEAEAFEHFAIKMSIVVHLAKEVWNYQ